MPPYFFKTASESRSDPALSKINHRFTMRRKFTALFAREKIPGVIPSSAFEIIPEAEYSGVADLQKNNTRFVVVGKEQQIGGDGGNCEVDEDSGIDDSTSNNAAGNSGRLIGTRNAGAMMASTSSSSAVSGSASSLSLFLISNNKHVGLFGGWRNKSSSVTVSSWIDDQSIYDEAEVRSTLPCAHPTVKLANVLAKNDF
ncbi:hypothetical protein HK100_012552 [Physocladia obscura]|uniref:Uncharacterized protein n=1 Tax=Physocladia obscura TaxID=109957 RepID=A0AAD5SZL0_9FUNG|nr:hypothetical protein HK100_012552 [Physocladia obscura]